MKKVLTIAVCAFALSACANDHYTVNVGGPGTEQQKTADLQVCKNQTLHEYIHDNHERILVGGLVGGAIGGLIVAGVSANNPAPGQMSSSDINPHIEACMAAKGYTGTSKN